MKRKVASKPPSTFALKRYRFLQILSLLRRAVFLHRRGQRDEMYNLIGEVLFDLGGVYIKFLQGVVLQSWMMQRWQNESKLDIFTKIKPKNLNVKKIVKNNLGPKSDRIQKLQTSPFAVGSFGHVYEAMLDGEQRVIVKILSPDIRKTLKFDLKLLKFFWYFYLKATNFNRSFNLRLIFADFKKQTLNEINYKAEVSFANQQYITYKDHPSLFIPQTYTELCTDEIIVQEYVEGIACANLLKSKERDPKFDVKAYVKKELNSDIVFQLQNLATEILWGSFSPPLYYG